MINNFSAFLIAAILLNISPGPDHIYILSRTLAQGKMCGFISSFGVCSGAMIHVLAAAFGFSIMIQSSPVMYAILKYAGSAYLLYLGVKAFKVNQFEIKQTNNGTPLSLKKVYFQGMMVDILNPKVALFFLAFLPPFIPKDCSNRTHTFIILGLIVILVAIIYEAILIIFSDLFLGKFLQNSKVAHYLNYIMGLIFIGLAFNFIFY